jgi:hypothetical protein
MTIEAMKQALDALAPRQWQGLTDEELETPLT